MMSAEMTEEGIWPDIRPVEQTILGVLEIMPAEQKEEGLMDVTPAKHTEEGFLEIRLVEETDFSNLDPNLGQIEEGHLEIKPGRAKRGGPSGLYVFGVDRRGPLGH